MFLTFIRKGSHGRVIGAVCLAVSATMLIAAPAAAYASPDGAAGSRGAAGTHGSHVTARATALEQARASALARARATRKKVPVNALTTADSSTVANPNGSFTTTSTAEPTRMKNASGSWENLSTALRHNASGTLSPAAEPGHLTLSAGGPGPLVTLAGNAGQMLTLTLPVTLPTPVVSGASATYRNIYPGVDLTVTARTTGGFSEVFTVRNAAAAARVPALTFHIKLTGLKLTADRSGNLRATDPRTGKVIMTAPPAASWDSATTAGPARHGQATHRGGGVDAANLTGATSSTTGPGLRAHTGPLTVSLHPGTLTLHTSTAALDGKPTFPVYYDPTWTLPFFSGGTQDSTEVQSACPDAQNCCANYTYFNSVSEIGVGFNEFSSCIGAMRAYYQVDTSGIINSSYIISSSTLQATEVQSADNSCGEGSETVSVYLSAPIGPATDWYNQPVQGGALASQSVESVGNADGSMCPGSIVNADFNAMPLITDARNGNWPNVTFALVGNESYSTSLERFANNPAITTVYEIPPNTPTALAASPAPVTAAGTVWQGCDGDIDGYLSAANLAGKNIATLSATLTSAIPAAEMYGYFEFYDHTTSTESFMTSSGFVTSGGTVSVQTPTLTDGHLYTWQVNSNDQYQSSPIAHYCGFTVDKTPPLKPAVTSTSFPPSGSGTSGVAAGNPGTLTVSSSDPAPASGVASGLKGFYYAIDTPVPTSGAAFVAASNGSAPVSFTPPANGWGTHTLYVEAVDNAGNISAPAQYSFFVPWNPEATVRAGDVNGDGIPDLIATDSAGDLVEYQGNSDPAAAPVTVSTTATSPDSTSWANYLVTHRGSMTNQGVDDLWAYNTTTHNLYLYKNNGSAAGGNFENTGGTVNISKADVLIDEQFDSIAGDKSGTSSCYVTSTGSCAGYDNTDWSDVTQILAPGDLYAGDPVAGVDSRTPGLLTVENGSLWYYQGQNFNDYLGTAIQLGSGGWNAFTLLAPGTVGGNIVLWARNNATGVIYQYPITFDAAGYPVDLGSPTTSGTVVSGVTLTSAAYPTVISSGPLTGGTCGTADLTACPGIYATDNSGDLWYYEGQSTAGGASPLSGTRILVGAPSTGPLT